MIDVRINKRNMTVIATGHANAPRNDDGRDMACAAVSTLVQTFIFSCQALPGVMVNHAVRPGDVYISVSAPDSQTEAVQHRMTMLEDGMRHMGEKYPMCINLK